MFLVGMVEVVTVLALDYTGLVAVAAEARSVQ